MPFKSWKDYWAFSSAVHRDFRYIYSDEVQSFLDSVSESSKERVLDIDQNTTLWRSQLGHDWRNHSDELDVPHPYQAKRMKPLVDQALEGRANPKGIPYLYLASDKETAMAEVRPWMGCELCVCEFILSRSIRLVDCSKDHYKTPIFIDEPDNEKKNEAVWSYIDRAFSEPVTPNPSSGNYAPTQILAELFRHDGFDGVVYKSKLSSGFNLVLFDLDLAEPLNCRLFQTENIDFKFRESGQGISYMVEGKHSL